MFKEGLVAFVTESNAIEGIFRPPTDAEIAAHESFMKLPSALVGDLVEFVSAVEPKAILRDKRGLDVRVGNHVPTPGGPAVLSSLEEIMDRANSLEHPWPVHCDYEWLHPFTDGNGRSGRVMWAWMMLRQGRNPFAIPFAQRFYYQTLEQWGT